MKYLYPSFLFLLPFNNFFVHPLGFVNPFGFLETAFNEVINTNGHDSPYFDVNRASNMERMMAIPAESLNPVPIQVQKRSHHKNDNYENIDAIGLGNLNLLDQLTNLLFRSNDKAEKKRSETEDTDFFKDLLVDSIKEQIILELKKMMKNSKENGDGTRIPANVSDVFIKWHGDKRAKNANLDQISKILKRTFDFYNIPGAEEFSEYGLSKASDSDSENKKRKRKIERLLRKGLKQILCEKDMKSKATQLAKLLAS